MYKIMGKKLDIYIGCLQKQIKSYDSFKDKNGTIKDEAALHDIEILNRIIEILENLRYGN